jgi:hypothetical protein
MVRQQARTDHTIINSTRLLEASNSASLYLFDGSEFTHQRYLFPQRKDELVLPVLTFRTKLKVKAIEHSRGKDAHFMVSLAITKVSKVTSPHAQAT